MAPFAFWFLYYISCCAIGLGIGLYMLHRVRTRVRDPH